MDETKKSSGSKLLKNNLESIILRALFDGKKYGYEIAKEIEEKTGGEVEVKQPTLYNVLKRLESNGLITSFWGEESHGGRRKYFSLTIEGFQLCQKQQSDWEYSRHLLDRLVSDKEFDGDKVNPEINITIDKKVSSRAPKQPRPKAEVKRRIIFENEDTLENAPVIEDSAENTSVLDIIDDINNDLTDIPEEQPDSSFQSKIDFEPTAEVSPEDEYLDELDDEIIESTPIEYYRELDRNIESLMDDIDEIDDTIESTGNLLESLSKTPKNTYSETPSFETPLGHINMDYLFNLYGKKEEPPVVVSPSPHPVTHCFQEESSVIYANETAKSFSASQKSSPVDIFEDEDEISKIEESPAISAEPPREEIRYVIKEAQTPKFADFSEPEYEESEAEREYKKIIGNLLYKRHDEETTAPHNEQRTLPKTQQPTTADKILSSVGAASQDFNLDGFENTGDMPSGGLNPANATPVGYDMLSELKEKLSQEGIKLRQYEKNLKSSTERYEFYFKNKLLFSVLWIVYLFALAELALIYFFFRETVDISWQILLAYSLVMLIFPLIGTVVNYSRNNLKVRAEWDFGYSLRDSLIIFILGFFVIIAIDFLFFQFAFIEPYDIIVKLTIPSVMLFNVVICTFIYRLLYRSKRYFVK